MSMTDEIYKMIGELSYDELKEVHQFIKEKFDLHKSASSEDSKVFMAQCKLGYYEDKGSFRNMMLFRCNNYYKVHSVGNKYIITGEKGFVKTFDAIDFNKYFNVSNK